MTIPRCARAVRVLHFEPIEGRPLQPLRYRRFATAAEAIQFAIEELPAVRALGAWMQVGDQRFDGDDIQRLYESDDYPLQRRGSD